MRLLTKYESTIRENLKGLEEYDWETTLDQLAETVLSHQLNPVYLMTGQGNITILPHHRDSTEKRSLLAVCNLLMSSNQENLQSFWISINWNPAHFNKVNNGQSIITKRDITQLIKLAGANPLYLLGLEHKPILIEPKRFTLIDSFDRES